LEWFRALSKEPYITQKSPEKLQRESLFRYSLEWFKALSKEPYITQKSPEKLQRESLFQVLFGVVYGPVERAQHNSKEPQTTPESTERVSL